MRIEDDEKRIPGRPLAEIIEVHAVVETIDERGRHGGTIGFFEDKFEAQRAAKGRGWYQGDAAVIPAKVLRLANNMIFVLDSRYKENIALNVDFVSKAKQELADAQKAALENLTPAQRKTLGLDF